MVKVCHDRCNILKCKKTTSPIYDNHRRCTLCSVYYKKDVMRCTCCGNLTRSKPHNSINREKYNSKTIRISDVETRHLYPKMLAS